MGHLRTEIELQQPQPFDLVGGEILVAGNGSGFEATLTVRVTEGHDEYVTPISAPNFGNGQFQGSIAIPDDNLFQLNRLFVIVSDDTGGEDGVEPPRAMVPVLYGPRILPGYSNWVPYQVEPGETLSGLAQMFYDDPAMWPAIHAANAHVIEDPDVIFVGQVLRIPRAAL